MVVALQALRPGQASMSFITMAPEISGGSLFAYTLSGSTTETAEMIKNLLIMIGPPSLG
jgi:hypothetical protein